MNRMAVDRALEQYLAFGALEETDDRQLVIDALSWHKKWLKSDEIRVNMPDAELTPSQLSMVEDLAAAAEALNGCYDHNGYLLTGQPEADEADSALAIIERRFLAIRDEEPSP